MKTALPFPAAAVIALLALFQLQVPLAAQTAGTLDATFTPSVPGGFIKTIAVQADGKILLGGSFGMVSGQARSNLARLHADGTVESTATFNPGVVNGVVEAVVVQPDGKILIAGGFSSVNGQPRNRIARLLPDGTVESTATFNPGTGANTNVSCMARQADGKILLGGTFTSVNGQARNRIARIHADGTLESTATFNPGSGVNSNVVMGIAVQQNGKILLGGAFNSVNGQPRGSIARLHADGTLESTATFNAGTGVISGGYVRGLAVQPDGKILLAGGFNSINAQPRGSIARLHADGTVESTATFNPGTGTSSLQCLTLQPDGKILIGGAFSAVNGQPRNRIARLNADGTVESTATFNAGTGANINVHAVTLQPTGGILLGGDFTTVAGQPRGRVARLAGDFNCDDVPVYEPILGFEGTLSPTKAAMLRYTDGNFYATSQGGGANNGGAIYRVTPAGAVSVLTHFPGWPDGGRPMGTLVSDAAGSLWGTAAYGGSMGVGTVFKVHAGTGEITTVASFTGGEQVIRSIRNRDWWTMATDSSGARPRVAARRMWALFIRSTPRRES